MDRNTAVEVYGDYVKSSGGLIMFDHHDGTLETLRDGNFALVKVLPSSATSRRIPSLNITEKRRKDALGSLHAWKHRNEWKARELAKAGKEATFCYVAVSDNGDGSYTIRELNGVARL